MRFAASNCAQRFDRVQIDAEGEARVLQVQFHDVKGSDLDQWKTDEKQTILWPDKYATGKAAYPYSEAKK